MKALLFAGLAAVVLLVLGYAHVASFFVPTKNFAWNQRMIVELETPQGEVRFESVQRVDVDYFGQTGGQGLTGREVNYRMEGQAAFVALPGGRVLFKLREGPGLAEAVYSVKGGKDGRRERLKRIVTRVGQAPVELEQRLWPRFAVFGDVARPETVTLLEPETDPDAFETALGPGYKLRAVFFQITDVPVAQGDLQDVLPWFQPIPGSDQRLCPPDGRSQDLPDCMRLQYDDFSWGSDRGAE